ncbi:hypothetical protein [Amycolatopsis sp. Poz14]|uniref:hypothetical protein n=1 Tax=Amycolatopsis sp. Poz14 TaxID=1447705 RepID=UPI001EE7CBAF|nr:hypothetical protein [Amycolatopsis sp. Poz14]MCG3755862.1 hypothetical protein [Amycolatopsis sp. Poz14]
MGNEHELCQAGAVIWRAAIGLGIGDDDTIGGVGQETDHATEEAARAWVTRELPRAEFPDWVTQRPHGAAGAFLHGSVTCGYLAADEPEPSWNPTPTRQRGTRTWSRAP